MMSAGPADLRERSGWTGTGDQSRRVLLDAIQREYIVGSLRNAVHTNRRAYPIRRHGATTATRNVIRASQDLSAQSMPLSHF